MEESLKDLHKLILEFGGKHEHVDNVMLEEFFDNVSNSLRSIIDDHKASFGQRPNPEGFKNSMSDLCNTVESLNANNAFTKQLSMNIFDILFDPELQSWILKEILKVYLRIIKKSDRCFRVSFTEETGFNYLGKLMDLILYADYEFQNMIVEIIFRMSDHKSLRKLVDIFCYEEEEKKAFCSITLEDFDRGSRRYLNIVNRKGDNVLSVLCHKVSFDDFDLQAPPELEEFKGLWIDINCKIETITFFIDNTPFINPSNKDSWEMVTILPETISDAKISYASGKEPGKTIAIGKLMFKRSVLFTASSHILQNCKTLVLYSLDVGKLRRTFNKIIPSMCRTDFMQKKTRFPKKVYRPLSSFRSSSFSRTSSNASSIVERSFMVKNRKYNSDIFNATSASSSLSIPINRKKTGKHNLYSLDDSESELENMSSVSEDTLPDGKTVENRRKYHYGSLLSTRMMMEQNPRKDTEAIEETKNSSKDSRTILLELMHETQTSVQPVHHSSSLLEELLKEPIQSTNLTIQPRKHLIKRHTVIDSSEISENESFVEINRLKTVSNSLGSSERRLETLSSDSAELDNIHNNTNYKKRSKILKRQLDEVCTSRNPLSDFVLKNKSVCTSIDHHLQNEPAEMNSLYETLLSRDVIEDEQDVVSDPFDALLKEKTTNEASITVEPEIEILNEPLPSKEIASSSEIFRTPIMDMAAAKAGSQQSLTETIAEIFETAESHVSDSAHKPTESDKPQMLQDIPDVNLLKNHESDELAESQLRAHLRSRAKVLSNTLLQPPWKVDQYKFDVELSTIEESRLLNKPCETVSQIEDSSQIDDEPRASVVPSQPISQETIDEEQQTDSRSVEKSMWALFKGLNTPSQESSLKIQDSFVLHKHGVSEFAEHQELLAVLDSQENPPENINVIQNTNKHSSNASFPENDGDLLTNQAEKNSKGPEGTVADELMVPNQNVDTHQQSLEMAVVGVPEDEKEEQSVEGTTKTASIRANLDVIETDQMRKISEELQPTDEGQLKYQEIEEKRSERQEQCLDETTFNKSKKRILEVIEEDATKGIEKKRKKSKAHKTEIDLSDKKYYSLKKRDTRPHKPAKNALILKRNLSTTSSKGSKRRLYDPTILLDAIPSSSSNKTARTLETPKLVRSLSVETPKTLEKRKLVRSPNVGHLSAVLEEFIDDLSKNPALFQPFPPRPKPKRKTDTDHRLDFTKYDLKKKGREKLRELQRNRGDSAKIPHKNDKIFKEFFASVDNFRKDFEAGRIRPAEANPATKKKLMAGAEFLINLM